MSSVNPRTFINPYLICLPGLEKVRHNILLNRSFFFLLITILAFATSQANAMSCTSSTHTVEGPGGTTMTVVTLTCSFPPTGLSWLSTMSLSSITQRQDSGSPVSAPGTGGSGSPSTPPGSEHSKSAQVDSSDEVTDCPVNIQNREKIMTEIDYVGSGEMPLEIIRRYAHRSESDANPYTPLRGGLFGYRWFSTLDTALVLKYSDKTRCATLVDGVSSADCSDSKTIETITVVTNGQQRIFWPPVGESGRWRLDNKNSHRSHVSRMSTGNWIYVDPEGNSYEFSSRGRLTKVSNINSISWSLIYGADGYLTRVVHSSGRALTFSWGPVEGSLTFDKRRVASVLLPNGHSISYARTGRHLAGVTFPNSTGTKNYEYKFSNHTLINNLTSVIVDGKRWSIYQYEAPAPSLTVVTNSGLVGGVNNSAFSVSGTTTTVTNAAGGAKTYTYDDKGRLISVSRDATVVCPSAASVIEYADPSSLNIQYKEDWNGNRTSYTYNSTQDIILEYSNGTTRENAWNPNGTLATVKVWDGAKLSAMCGPHDPCPSPRPTPAVVVEYTYDSRNRVVSESRKALKSGSLEYTPERLTTYSYVYGSTNLVSKKVVDGPIAGSSDVTTYSYNSRGDLISIAQANGDTTTLRYLDSAGGHPYEIADPNGLVINFKYDSRGRLSEKTVNGPNVMTTRYEYYGDNKLKKVTYPKGNYESYLLDDARRVSRVTRSTDFYLHEYDQYEYDLESNIKSVKTFKAQDRKCADGISSCPVPYLSLVKSSRTFDAHGKMIDEIGQNSQSVSYQYDANGNITSEVNSLGETHRYLYNIYGQLELASNPDGETTVFNYDSMGFLASVTDGENNTTYYSRNAFGEIEQLDSPESGRTYYQYNEVGQPTQINDARNVTATSTYDDLGRRIGLATDVDNPNIKLFYDTTAPGSSLACINGRGRLCGYTDSSGRTDYSYNSVGQLMTQRNTIGGVAYNLTHSYTPSGMLAETAYPNGVVVKYGYDINNNRKSFSLIINGTYKSGMSKTRYYDRDIYFYNFNSRDLTKRFDTDGRIYNLSSAGDLSYTFDMADRVLSATNGKYPNDSLAFGYDKAGRLTSTSSSSTAEAFTYDDNGNRTHYSRNSSVSTYSTSTNSSILNSVSGTQSRSYTYDAVGNVTAQTGNGGRRFTARYDGLGHLVVLDPDAASGEAAESYWYNAINQRVRKNGPRGDYRYLYSPDGKLLAETEKSSSTIGTIYIYFDDEVVALVRNNAVYQVLNDRLGRPEVIVDAAKEVVWRASHGAFGRSVAFVKPSFGAFNLGFPGQYYDEASDLWFNSHRYFDASIGRYIQSDPSGLDGGMNTYAYANNNPTFFTDPQGLAFIPEGQIGHGRVFETPGVRVQAWIVDTPTDRMSGFGPIPKGADVDMVRVGDAWYKIKSGDAVASYDRWGNPVAMGLLTYRIPGKDGVPTLNLIKYLMELIFDGNSPESYIESMDPCVHGPVSVPH